MPGIKYIVKEGDTLIGISKAFGFYDYKTIYNDPSNTQFKNKRPDPHIIYTGDEITIPEKGSKTVNIQVGNKAKFKIANQKQILRLRFSDFGEPIKKEPFSLIIKSDGLEDFIIENKKTDDTGMIEELIPTSYINPHGQTVAHVIIKGIIHRINIGSLDPISTISGIQQRLKNGGYTLNDEKGVFGQDTYYAIRAFQEMNGLEVTGKINDEFRSKLSQYHDNDSNLLSPEDDFTPNENVVQDDHHI